MTSILFVTGTIYSNQFQCNYLRNKKTLSECFAPFLKATLPSNVWLRYLGVLNHQERLNNIKKGSKDNFRGDKTQSKGKPMYLEVKLKEAKFD